VAEEHGEPSAELLRTVFEEVARGAPVVISVYDIRGIFLMQIGRGLEKLGLARNQLVGASVYDAFKGADDALARISAAMRGETSQNTQDLGASIWDNWFGPLRDAAGTIIGAVSISTDVTERERARAELLRRIEIIEAQAQAIRALGSPIIQVWQDVLVMPVIGELDAERAAQMMEKLLSALSASRARHAILDLTGVEAVDSSTADELLRILRSVALLGVQGLVSGIQPAVARTLAALDAGLGRVTIVATLHDALRRCMGERAAPP